MFNIYFFEDCSKQRELMYTSENPKTNIVIPSNLNFKLDGGDNIDLEMYVENPFYDRFSSLKNEVILEEDSVIIYRGRLLSIDEDFDVNGILKKTIVLTGCENYFKDLLLYPGGLVYKDNSLSAIIMESIEYMKRREKYSFSFVENSFSKNTKATQ